MNAREITLALRGKWHGRYGIARCPGHGDRNPSLSLGDGHDGRLLLSCKAGCSFMDVLNALRDRGILDHQSGYTPPSPSEIAKREAEDREAAKRIETRARATWTEAQPIRGTIAESYLRGRGISCDLPDTLRFHPEAWHGPTARRLPAMIARIDDGEGFAIHRTFIQPDGSGKADVPEKTAKMAHGRMKGGHVKVAKGDGALVVAEGIETALSLASGLLRRPATIWAGCGTIGVSGLRLPERPHRLTIASDGDPAGHKAANQLAERASALGWTVSLLPAPDGTDWNDILQKKGAAA